MAVLVRYARPNPPQLHRPPGDVVTVSLKWTLIYEHGEDLAINAIGGDTMVFRSPVVHLVAASEHEHNTPGFHGGLRRTHVRARSVSIL